MFLLLLLLLILLLLFLLLSSLTYSTSYLLLGGCFVGCVMSEMLSGFRIQSHKGTCKWISCTTNFGLIFHF